MNTVQNTEALDGFNALILVIGLALLLMVVVLSFREWRLRQNRQREGNTRLMIGQIDLYNPVDQLKATTLINDLYQIYLESYRECGSPLDNNEATFNNFVVQFAHPYFNGKLDMSFMPDNVAKVFREKHYAYIGQSKSA
jgi:hypothetical protein